MIKVYTKDFCPYCVRAKSLLTQLGLDYEEVALGSDIEKIGELVKETGMRTLPQIFISNKLIGGYDDLKSLVDSGKIQDIL
jgi:GrxC family glutaredoxin